MWVWFRNRKTVQSATCRSFNEFDSKTQRKFAGTCGDINGMLNRLVSVCLNTKSQVSLTTNVNLLNPERVVNLVQHLIKNQTLKLQNQKWAWKWIWTSESETHNWF